MKKIYNFLALMLLFVAGSLSAVAAERDWTVWGVAESQIETPQNGMFVVLQQGGNTDGWSSNGYLNPSGSFKAAVDASCVYELVKVGEDAQGDNVFVLKNFSNKQYIYSGGHTLSYGEAFQCTILKGEAGTTDLRRLMSGNEKQPDSEGNDWVFSGPLPEDGTNPTYLCYWGCPAYSSYNDTNNWRIYEATPHQPTADEKLEIVYNEVFKNGFSDLEFAVGDQPGNISQELHDKIEAAYNAANDAMGNDAVSAEAKEKIVQDILDAQEKLNNGGRIMLVPGKYYMFISQRSQDGMFDTGGSLKCTKDKVAADVPPTLNDAKYLWTVEDAGNGQYYIKNFATGRYAGKQGSTSSTFPTVEGATVKCNVAFNPNGEAAGLMFNITDEDGNMWHCDAGMNVVRWQSKNGLGCLFAIKEVPADVADQLTAVVEKARFMKKYHALVGEAKSTSEKYKLNSDVTFDDKYASAGLVSSFEKCNATEPSEGKEAYAFDGNLGTYYHTLWSGNVDGEYHWAQVNLGDEPIQKLFLKFSQRHNNRGGNPSRIALVAQADGDDPEGAWTDTLFKDTVIYQYATNFPNGTIDSTTTVMRIDLGKPVQHLRFVGLQTKVNQLHGLGPCWHVSELRFYKDGGDNPRYNMIPEEVRQKLADAIANAEKLASDSSATQADYEALEAVIKEFNDAYPDDTELLELLKDAKAQAEAEGMVGTAWGYFPEDAQSGLKTTVDNVSSYVEANSPLSLTAIADQLKALRSAISTFNSKLIVPEDGAIVRIKSVSQNQNGDQNGQYGNIVYARNADTVANVYWGYKDDENQSTRLNAVWQLRKQADGSFVIKNLATGLNIANLYDGVEDKDEVELSQRLSSTKEDSKFTLVSGKLPGVFNIQFVEGRYMNADPNNNVVNWSGSDASSLFVFDEVSSDVVSDGMTYNVKANAYQIVTMPFEIQYVEPAPYKLLGQKDGKAQLQLYSESEIIPAGTPFIVKTDEDINYLQIGIQAADASELANGTYVYDHVNQNGMVGTLNSLTVNAGLGLLLDGVIKNSVDNTTVDASTGYFVEIPETTEDGDIALNIEDVINGINNAVVSNAKGGAIYTISGVKVRANSTVGLPKGLYIVNGKKVYVK